MAQYQVSWNATTKVATIQANGDAITGSSTKIGEFEFGGDGDLDSASRVVWHHVRDLLYHAGHEDMQIATINQDILYTAVTGVTVSPTTSTKAVAATQQLTPTVAPVDASNKLVMYSTSDAAKATVSSSGLVTAVASGSATITVTTVDGGFTATCVMTIS